MSIRNATEKHPVLEVLTLSITNNYRLTTIPPESRNLPLPSTLKAVHHPEAIFLTKNGRCAIAARPLTFSVLMSRYPVDILPGQGQGIPAQTPATGMPCTPRVVLQGLAGMRVMPTLSYRQAVFPAISSSSILSPSLRIFIAAFRSRSVVKPHLSHT